MQHLSLQRPLQLNTSAQSCLVLSRVSTGSHVTPAGISIPLPPHNLLSAGGGPDCLLERRQGYLLSRTPPPSPEAVLCFAQSSREGLLSGGRAPALDAGPIPNCISRWYWARSPPPLQPWGSCRVCLGPPSPLVPPLPQQAPFSVPAVAP